MFWRGVLGYLPVNIVQGVVGLLTIVVFTRLLTPEQYGAYAIAFSVVSLVHTATFTWLEAAVARFQAAEAKAGTLADHFTTIYRAWFILALSIPVAAGLILTFWPMSQPLKLAVAVGLAGTLFRGLARIAQERRRAAGEVAGAAALDIAQTAGGFGLGAVLAYAGLGGAAPLAGVGAVAALCLAWVLPTELKFAKGGRFEPSRIRTYAAFGLPLSLSLILALALSTADRFMLAAFLNEETVGVYHAGYSLANRTLDVIFIWLGMAAGPAAIAALETGGRPALEQTARQQSAFMLLIALPAAVGLAMVARPLAEALIGEGLREGAAQVTPWIAASGFFAGLTTYYFHMAFTLARNTRLLLLAMLVPAIANIALNLALIPTFGLDGAMWATTASYGLGLVASILLGRRVMPLPISWETLIKAGAASLAMAAVVSLVPAIGGWTELIVKACLGAAVYGAAAFALDAGGARRQAGRLLRAAQGAAG